MIYGKLIDGELRGAPRPIKTADGDVFTNDPSIYLVNGYKLKDDGVLIAPIFTHAGNSFTGKVRAFFMKLAGFPLHSRWTSEEYLRFLRQNGWAVRKNAVLKASFPLTYAECVKSEV